MTPRLVPQTPFGIQNTFHSIPKGALSAANPIARRAYMFPSQSRQMSTALRPRFQQPDLLLKKIGESQKRTLFGGATSRSILAHLEETANKNPNSATSQYAFYQALTRANMPAIIVERYQTNQFATNAGNLTNAQLQAIGQAVAASSRGGNVAVSRGPNVGSGAKDSPLHVVVEETISGQIFKWVKFFLYFGLFTYLSLVVVAMVIETFQTFR
jgi:ATP-dependent metalloprotease